MNPSELRRHAATCGLAALVGFSVALAVPAPGAPLPVADPPESCDGYADTPLEIWRCELGLPPCTHDKSDPFCVYLCEVDTIAAAAAAAIGQGMTSSSDNSNSMWDVTSDGVLDANDWTIINYYLNNVDEPVVHPIWDLNRNWDNDLDDLMMLGTLLTAESKIVDVNLDGVVDSADQAILVAAWQAWSGPPTE